MFLSSLLYGVTWEKVCASSPFDGKQIFGMSRVTDGKLYLCTWANTAGVFRIDLDGTLNPPYTALWAKKDFMDLKVSPFDPGILHGVNWDGLYYKMSGVTGTSATNTSAQLNSVVSAACSVEPDRADPLRILAGTYDGLYRSDDGGASFYQINAQGFVQLEQSPWDANIFYAVCLNWNNGVSFGGVYKYEMSSNSLTAMGLAGIRTRSMAIDTNNPGCFYVLADNGQAYYYNGTSFITKGQYPGEASATSGRECALAYYGGKEYLFACGEAAKVYVSTDGASTWQRVSDGLTAGGLMLKYDSSTGYMYHGSNGAGLWRFNLAHLDSLTATSTRTFTPTFTVTATFTATPTATVTPVISGNDWVYVAGSGMGSDAVDYCGYNSQGKGIAYMSSWAGSQGVFRIEYDETGASAVPVAAIKDFTDFKRDPEDNNTIWGTNYTDYKLYKFTNALAMPTVTVMYTFPDRPINVSIDRNDSNKMVCATFGGLYRSTDRGQSWNMVNGGNAPANTSCWIVEQSPADGDTYFVLAVNMIAGGAYKYNFSSDTYELLGLYGEDTKTIALDPAAPGNFYVACRDGKVFYYNGSSFELRGNMMTGYVCGIAAPQCMSGTLVGWGRDEMVKISTDGGANWNSFSSGLPCGINDLTYDCDRGYLTAVGVVGTGGIYINRAYGFDFIMPTNTPVPTNTPLPVYTATATQGVEGTPEPTATFAVTVTDRDTEVYPSVGKDEVKIVFNINKKADIKIYVYAVDGRLVDTVDYKTGWTPNDKLYRIKLDTGKYPSGVYFYTIQGKDDTGKIINFKSKKFIIKR